MQPIHLETPSLSINAGELPGSLTFRDRKTGFRLMVADLAGLMSPVIDGRPVAAEWRPDGSARTATTVRFSSAVEAIGSMTLEVTAHADDAIDFRFALVPVHALELNALRLFPAGTQMLMDDVVNFRNRHHTVNTWPELLLGGEGFSTTTFSDDWQFAPHPSMLMLRKMEATLFVGCFDLPVGAFGIELAAAEHRIKHWRITYGSTPNGLKLSAGETFRSPTVRMFLRHNLDVYGMLDQFTSMLQSESKIPDPTSKRRHAWWREPLYCTWTDQTFAAEVLPPADLREQAAQPCNGPVQQILNADFVRRAAKTILAENLPFRTILIDDGWQVARGQWEPHPERFPDFRGLVDELHALGFKVVVWWNWAEIDSSARVDADHLFGNGKLNRHGSRVRDYSKPSVQDDYLRPLFRKMFSGEGDCYDLDGVKTDFLADKVHPDLEPSDPTWRGEEAYFEKITALFYAEMKRLKADAIHIGCAGHFWLAEHIDINRTYDVWTGPMEHESRALMLRHTAPGVPVAYDFYNFLDGLEVYFDSAERTGASVQIGNILYVRHDPFAPPRPAAPAYYALLRERLSRVAFQEQGVDEIGTSNASDRNDGELLASTQPATRRSGLGVALNAALIVLIALFLPAAALAADDAVPAKPTMNKKIYAHYMGCYPVATAAPADERRESGPNVFHNGPGKLDRFGGQWRNWPLVPQNMEVTLEQSMDLEIRRAMRAGMDGFVVDMATDDYWYKVIAAMFKVAEEKDYPFEISCVLDNVPDPAGQIRWLVNTYGRSPKLARRNGKPFIAGYYSTQKVLKIAAAVLKTRPGMESRSIEDLVNSPELRTTVEGWQLLADGFKELERQVGTPLSWQFSLEGLFMGVDPKIVKPDMIVRAAEVFARNGLPVGAFVGFPEEDAVAQAVKAAGGEWAQPMWFQYENAFNGFLIETKGFEPFRTSWERARKYDSPLIQFITWNDYTENTHLAPAYETRYTLFDLTGYFVRWWKTGRPPQVDRDQIYLSYPPYAAGAKTFPFESRPYSQKHVGVLEVLTILPAPATVRLPGRGIEYEAPAGMFAKQFPAAAGPIAVEVARGGAVVTTLRTPEPITDKPYREQTGMVCYSTEEQRQWEADFPGIKPFFPNDYADDDGDGLPNWFEMYWFGKFLDYSTCTIADAKADLSGDGRTNLQKYLDQANPTPANSKLH